MYGPDGFWLYLHRKCTCAVVGDSIKVEEDMRAWMSKRLYIFYIIYKENKTASNYTSVSLSLKHVRFVFLCSLGIIWRQLVCVISVVCFVVVISLTLCCRQTPEQTGFVCVCVCRFGIHWSQTGVFARHRTQPHGNTSIQHWYSCVRGDKAGLQCWQLQTIKDSVASRGFVALIFNMFLL